MSDEPKIKAVAPWFGGKRTMAPAIVVELGTHTQYFEPFCGSMAVLFAKQRSSQETVCDLHADVTNLAWVLQDPETGPELYGRAARTLFAEDMIRSFWLELAETACPNTADPERAYKFFVFSWAIRNGIAGTSRMRGNGFQIARRYTPRGGSPTIRFQSAVESIPAWAERLQNVVILRRDAFAVLPKFEDSEKLAIYADPPYHAATRSGFLASSATSTYEHDFEHDSPMFGDDHTRLRDILATYKHARVVVSYYDHPRIRELYDGWTIVEHTRQKHLHNQNRRGAAKKEAREILILNGESYA